MASNSRAFRFLKALETYMKERPNNFDCKVILSKIKPTLDLDGCMKGTFTVDATMCNGLGTLHGGYIASVIDVMSFFTLLSKCDGNFSLTTSAHINFFKSTKMGDAVSVDTKVLKLGNNSIVEACLYNNIGTLLAKGVTSFRFGDAKSQEFVKKTFNFHIDDNL